MGLVIMGETGPRIAADGAMQEVRLGRTGELVTTDAHGRVHEAAVRGAVFAATTAVAGVAPGTALSTTPPMALWNPPNSGVVLSVLRTRLGFVSGTLGAGTVVYAAVSSQQTVPATGTELVPSPTNLSAKKASGRAFQGSTVASTPTILLPAFVLGTTPTTPAAAATVDDVAGEIVVSPGTCLVMQGVAAAGTTPLVLFGLTWEEILVTPV